MNKDSIIYDQNNYVKLDEREKFHFDGDFMTAFLGYFTTMLVGVIVAMFLFSFMPNLIHVFQKGYQAQFILEYTFQYMTKDFFPAPSATPEIPKVWAIPVIGAVFAASLRMFYKSE